MNNNDQNNSFYVRAVRSGKCSLLSFESVYQAYLDCRRRKRGTMNALRFEFDVLENLNRLMSELQDGTYRPSRSVCFITRQPKLREVFAADFRDRIVHHLVVREIEKYWESRFIYDSYASRPGKGIHIAAKRLQQFMLKATKSRKQAAWYLKLDVRSFFMSIDRPILYSILESHTDSEVIRSLIHTIIFHDCTQNYVFKGNPKSLENIPPHKSLFKVGKTKGLPIGNYTSQFFANVYLNELDHFVKHTLKCRFYLRYVDDFILIASNPEQLLVWKEQITQFLSETLALELKADFSLKRVSEGADFLGYIVRPDYILCRRRVVNNMKYKLVEFWDALVSVITVNGKQFHKISFDKETIIKLRQTLASYLGHFCHANTFRLTNTLFDKHKWLNEIFTLEKGRLRFKSYTRHRYRFLKTQVNFFRSRFKGYMLFIQVGKFIELYDNDAIAMSSIVKLKMPSNARGMKHRVGFLKHAFPIFIRKALDAGYKAILIEEGEMGEFIRDRFVKELYVPVM